MTLRIVKSTDVLKVEQLILCIYGPPGVGKTTLGFSAEAPLLLDCDKGAYRASNRKDVVPVGSWSEIASVTADDLANYHTLILDTAGRALDFLSADIIANNPKLGRAGALTLQGYGELKAKFSSWLKMLRTLGKDIVLIAHMDEQRNGDEIIERLDVQGSSKGEIYKSADAMGRIFIRDKKRVIDFSPRENAFGKNPCGLEVIPLPEPSANGHFLGELITTMKTRLNNLSAEQKQAQDAMDAWVEAIAGYGSVDDFNKNITEVKKLSQAIQFAFAARAKNLGFVYSKTRLCYEATEQPKPPATEERSLADLFA